MQNDIPGENSESAEFFEEREKMLERQAEESASPPPEPVVIPVPGFESLQQVMDFIRSKAR